MDSSAANSKTIRRRSHWAFRAGFVAIVMSASIFGNVASAQDKSGSRDGLMKLPEAGGTVSKETGTFQISSNKGSSTFNLPLPPLPSRANFAPEVNVIYSQFGGDQGGGLGMGWGISVPSIEVSSEQGLPLAGFEASGELKSFMTLEGQKLIFIKDTGDTLVYHLKASEEDVRVIYHKTPLTLNWAQAIEGEKPSFSKGFEVIEASGRHRLFSGDLKVAEGDANIVVRYPLVYEVSPFGESIAYQYLKDQGGGRSYVKDIIFAGGASRYHFETDLSLSQLTSYSKGIRQQNRYLYTKLVASFKDAVHSQWCFAYMGRDPNDRSQTVIRSHPDCQATAELDLRPRIDPNSLSILDELRTIYRYGSDMSLGSKTLMLPSMSFDYSSWSKAGLANRKIVYPMPGLASSTGFSVKNYELADVNHDGLVDALRRGTDHTDIFLSSGNTSSLFDDPREWTLSRDSKTISPDLSAEKFHFADINGDSFIDLIEVDGRVAYLYLGQAEGGFSWNKETLSLSSDNSLSTESFEGGKAQFLDINGDGKSDILTTGSDAQGHVAWKLYLNLSTKNSAGQWVYKFSAKSFKFPWSTDSISLADSNFRITDVNGDKLPDIVYTRASSEAGESGICVYLNEGKLYNLKPTDLLFGHSSEQNARCGLGGDFMKLNGMRGTNKLGAWLADVNGDGILDAVSVGDTINDLLVWIGFGDIRFSDEALHLNLNLPVRVIDQDLSRTRVADIDGDGQAEILIFDETPGSENSVLMIDFNREDDRQLIKSNLLTSVEYSSGLRHDIRYATSTSERMRDIRLGLPVAPLHFPLVVAKQMITSQGIPLLQRHSVQVEEYYYHKPYYDADDLTFLGFSEVEKLNYGDQYAAQSSLTKEGYYTYSQDPAARKLAGKLAYRQVMSVMDDAEYAKEAINTNDFQPSDPATHSWINKSMDQALPRGKKLISSESFEWKTDNRGDGSFYVRMGKHEYHKFDEELGLLGTATYHKTATSEDYDLSNLAHALKETLDPINAPFGTSVPGYVTETSVDYEGSRTQLSEIGVVNLPDYEIITRNGEAISTKSFEYNDLGLLTKQVSIVESHLKDIPDVTGFNASSEHNTIFTYDGYGNKISMSDSIGTFEKLVYDADGVLPTVRILPSSTDKNKDQQWTLQYKNGRVERFVSPLGLVRNFEYDSLGRRSRLLGSDGSEQEYAYREAVNGNPSFVLTRARRYQDNEKFDAGETRWISQLAGYNPDGTAVATLEDVDATKNDVLSGVRVKEYKVYNRNKQKLFTWTPFTIREFGAIKGLTVDKVFAQLDKVPVPADQIGIATSYDYLGRVLQEVYPSGMKVTFDYAPWGSASEGHYAQGSKEVKVRSYKIESDLGIYGTVEQAVDSGETHVTQYTPDNLGNLSSVLLPGEATARQFIYNTAGKIEQQIIPGLGKYVYVYDVRDRNIATVRTTADGLATQKAEQIFDTQDRILNQKLDDQVVSSNVYDTYPEDMNVTPAYGKAVPAPVGLLTQARTFDPQKLYNSTSNLVYDSEGRIIARKMNLGGADFNESYRFLVDGTLKGTKNPMGMEGFYSLDGSGALHSVAIQLPNREKRESIIDSVSYNGKGQIDNILYRPIGDDYAETRLIYDDKTLQVKQIKTHFTDAGQTKWLQDLAIELDGNQNVLSVKDSAPRGLFGHVDRTANFQYDWKSQLTSSTRYGRTLNYEYLPNGAFKKNEEMGPGEIAQNPISSLIPSGVEGQAYSFDGFGQLIKSPTIKSARYNALGQLVFVETEKFQSFFGYDSTGERIYKRVVNKVEHKTSDSLYPMLSMAVEPSGRQSYIFVGDSRLVRLEENTGEWYYYLKDHLSSSDIVMHSSGKPVEQMLYQAYGTEEDPSMASSEWNDHLKNVAAIIPQEKTHHRFTGHYLDDDTGLYYMKTRFYDPKLGRFTSPDPKFRDAPVECFKSALECGLFNYARNNPLKFIDPNGQDAKVFVDYTSMTIKVKIDIAIYGSGANATVQKDIKASIEKEWSGKSYTDPASGKTFAVTFEASVSITSGKADTSGKGAQTNQIKIVSTTDSKDKADYTSYVKGNGKEGSWNSADTSGGWVYAHESGHLLGLGDQYKEVGTADARSTKANAGYEDNMMGARGGTVNQRNLGLVVGPAVAAKKTEADIKVSDQGGWKY